MESNMHSQTAYAGARGRACEGCREAKIRCRASQQPGVCQKCLDSKKECISRAGPRTRRGRRAPVECNSDSSSASPSSNKDHPSTSTFSIDFALAADPEPEDSLDSLRDMHEKHLESILPSAEQQQLGFGDTYDHYARPPSPALTPASTKEFPMTSLDGKPQFNLSSAESLLAHFISMAPQLPCIALSQSITVRELAARKPFLLLAILTVASASKTLKGHGLYDAEFRKVLSLKFVAAGERSLELLQGLLVYCIWYPFQIRPQSKQIFHHVRMAGDLVRDLGLDDEDAVTAPQHDQNEHLDRLRAYAGYSYLQSAFVSAWKPLLTASSIDSSLVLRCCDTLELLGHGPDDVTLAALARLGIMSTQAATAIYKSDQQTEEQRRLLLLGLQTRSLELQHRLPLHIASSVPIRIGTLYLALFLPSAGLLNRPNPSRTSRPNEELVPDPLRLISAVPAARNFLEYILSLPRATMSNLTAIDWGRMILAIILCIRLSVPVESCPEFDSRWARDEIRLHDFLDRMSSPDLDEAGFYAGAADALSATCVILRVVKRKFEQRVAAAEQEAALCDAAAAAANIGTCPLLDGSLDQYLSAWDTELNIVPQGPAREAAAQGEERCPMSGHASSGEQRHVFHDIWATMTVGWANEPV